MNNNNFNNQYEIAYNATIQIQEKVASLNEAIFPTADVNKLKKMARKTQEDALKAKNKALSFNYLFSGNNKRRTAEEELIELTFNAARIAKASISAAMSANTNNKYYFASQQAVPLDKVEQLIDFPHGANNKSQ